MPDIVTNGFRIECANAMIEPIRETLADIQRGWLQRKGFIARRGDAHWRAPSWFYDAYVSLFDLDTPLLYGLDLLPLPGGRSTQTGFELVEGPPRHDKGNIWTITLTDHGGLVRVRRSPDACRGLPADVVVVCDALSGEGELDEEGEAAIRACMSNSHYNRPLVRLKLHGEP